MNIDDLLLLTRSSSLTRDDGCDTSAGIFHPLVFVVPKLFVCPLLSFFLLPFFFSSAGQRFSHVGWSCWSEKRGRGNQDRPFDSNRSMSNPSIKSLLTLDEVKRRINHQLPSCSRGKKTKTNPSSKSLISRHTHTHTLNLMNCYGPVVKTQTQEWAFVSLTLTQRIKKRNRPPLGRWKERQQHNIGVFTRKNVRAISKRLVNYNLRRGL